MGLYSVPMPHFQELHTLRYLRELGEKLDCPAREKPIVDEKGLHVAKEEFNQLCRPINTLVAACKSALKGLTNAKAAKEAHERSRAADVAKQDPVQGARGHVHAAESGWQRWWCTTRPMH